MQSILSGRVEIGRQARLRIWCRKAYGFDSLRPNSKREPSLVLFFRTGECPPFHVTLLLNPPPREEDLPSAIAENVRSMGIEDSSQPLSLRDIPFQGRERYGNSPVGFFSEQPAVQDRLHRPLPMVGSGGPAASTFCESLADADAAALKRLPRFASLCHKLAQRDNIFAENQKFGL